MLVFGHVGITSIVARGIDLAFPAPGDESGKGFRGKLSKVVNAFRGPDGTIDYRMVIIGSMLPDIVDKPLFLLMNDSTYFSGRGFSHSLLFSILLLGSGLIFRKARLLVLWFGGLMHLVLDQIWQMQVTLFWPFKGWFIPYDSENWFENIWSGLIHNPDVYIPEVFGFLVVIYFTLKLVMQRGIYRFIVKGTISQEKRLV